MIALRNLTRRQHEFRFWAGAIVAFVIGYSQAYLIHHDQMSFSQPSNMGREAGFCGQAGQAIFSPAPAVSGTNFPAHKNNKAHQHAPACLKNPCDSRGNPNKQRKAHIMAQARFKETEMTTTEGEVIKLLEGEVLTRRDKLLVKLTPVVDEGACINAKEFTHQVTVRGVHGLDVDSGVAWTKRNADGTLYYSVTMNDPVLNISLWPDDENAGEWVARANNIRSAA